jgi:hypothetical protein
MSPFRGLIYHEKGYLSFHAFVVKPSSLFDGERFDQRMGAALLYLDDRDDQAEWPERCALVLPSNLPKNISRSSSVRPRSVESWPQHLGLNDGRHR